MNKQLLIVMLLFPFSLCAMKRAYDEVSYPSFLQKIIKLGRRYESYKRISSNIHEALFLAVQKNNEFAVKLLVQEGADPHRFFCYEPILNLNAIMAAADQGNTRIVEVLCASGKADLNVFFGPSTDNYSGSPLTLAAGNGNEKMVRTLLALGADPNFKDGAWNTPLHHAVRQRMEEVIPLLLQAGADPLILNLSQHTPYDFARSRPALHDLFIPYLPEPSDDDA